MLEFLWRWFGRKKQPPPSGDDRVLQLEREVQSLRLDIQERDRLIATLQGDLERLERQQQAQLEEAVSGALERLLSEAAGPAAQLATQAYLLEHEGKPVTARDILAVARRLLRVLEDEGLQLEGAIGQRVPFDPNRYELLGGDEAPVPGEPVVVRISGASYQGKVLRKASVEKAGA